MRVEFIAPFMQAAREVLESEIGGTMSRGPVRLQRSAYTTKDVTALIGVTGDVSGVVLFSLSDETARGLVSQMMGQDFLEFDALAQSGIGELGNVITGRAAVLLAEQGFTTNISPPTLIIGKGTLVSTLDLDRLVVPLLTAQGEIEIQVVLKEAVKAAAGMAAA